MFKHVHSLHTMIKCSYIQENAAQHHRSMPTYPGMLFSGEHNHFTKMQLLFYEQAAVEVFILFGAGLHI
ncbi:hypothetical protein A616_26650 [Brevibacillus brevis X23]|uniref:Uncharacterized protein n=1 Tax=Brevibacillus porteri TaxID=2126350 RepID=A0ABX5FQX6_9BACL|nr:hypothetical protein A616_26650 [Brevibacillus brevis X23]PSK10700.1 hypothetical protein C7R92_11715 [Brevibacillus porteri]